MTKNWLVGVVMIVSSVGQAAVPSGMPDTELKDTLVFLARQKPQVQLRRFLMLEAQTAGFIGGAMLGFAPAFIPRVRAHIATFAPSINRISGASFIGFGLGSVGGALLLETLVKLGRTNFDPNGNIERQHFSDLKYFFSSPVDVQYVIASENSDLREHLVALAAWIKAGKANQDTAIPSLKYQQLVPVAQ